MDRTSPPLPAPDRPRLRWEIFLVLACTVGQSALYSVLQLVQAIMSEKSLGQQKAQLNPKQDVVAFWDVTYQLLGAFFGLCLVGLVLFLLWPRGGSPFRLIGLDFRDTVRDVGRAALIAAAIGIPGLGLYFAGRALDLTRPIEASPLNPAWWTIPLLIVAALRAGLTEEVIFLGYLGDRLRRLGWSTVWIIVFAAILRGLYHAYQGFGPIIGNIVMGLAFGWLYHRWGRVMPLVIAHALIDIVAFVGYPLAVVWWPALFA